MSARAPGDLGAQLPLPLPVRTARGRSDYFVSASNAAAVAALDAWPRWPRAKAVLVGPEGTGKTHLAHVWAEEAGGTVRPSAVLREADLTGLGRAPLALEDAEAVAGDPAAEDALFHLHNLMAERGTPLLLTAREAPSRWALALPDLASRLGAATVIALPPPDDALLQALIVKLLADRQVDAPPSLVPWLAARIERSAAAAQDAIDRLDRAALAAGRPITLPLARKVLGNG